ncbi:MAG: hypothetical protein WAV31_01810 [Candidatus Moraniibacteriota bacterium]
MKNILIKASGDVLNNEKFIEFVKDKAKENNVVVICGGGTQISSALVKAGYEIKYCEYGRVTKDKEEKEIVKNVLKKEKNNLQKKLENKNIKLVIPVLMAGNVECFINADNLVKAYYLGFDQIYIFTLNDRIKNKKEAFASYKKVRIIGI